MMGDFLAFTSILFLLHVHVPVEKFEPCSNASLVCVNFRCSFSSLFSYLWFNVLFKVIRFEGFLFVLDAPLLFSNLTWEGDDEPFPK
jgi:hypothetical protein